MIFKYNSFTNFKRKLGNYNLVINSNELSNLTFLDSIKTTKELSELAKKYSFYIHSDLFVEMVIKMPHLYIVSAYQQAEIFLQQFKKEFIKRNRYEWVEKYDWNADKEELENIFSNKEELESLKKKLKNNNFRIVKDGKQNETLFRGLIRNLALLKSLDENAFISKYLNQEIVDGFEYYRQVRNKFIHLEKYNDAKLDEVRNKSINHREWYEDKFNIRYGLNRYSNLNIKDYHLFSAILIHLGYSLANAAKPSNKILAEELLNDGNNLQILKRLIPKKRGEKGMKNMINIKFGDVDNEDAEEIIKEIKKAVL